MRARGNFTYTLEKIFEPQDILTFIQKHANLSDDEIYQTLNMGQDYALFIQAKDVLKVQEIIRKNKFESLNAGYVEKGPRQVIISPKNITFKSETLDLR
jgi:phosphoribosylaminoimidazole (AIR) synthetase